MNTNFTYNRAGCTALMRGKIHSQNILSVGLYLHFNQIHLYGALECKVHTAAN